MGENTNNTNSEPTVEPTNEPTQVTNGDDTAEKGLTQAEVDKLITEAKEQAANEALENYKKEQEKQANLEKMSEKERLAKQLEELKEENKRLAANMKRNQMITQARSELAKDGLAVPDNVLDFIVTNDEKQTLSNMQSLKEWTDVLHKEWEAQYSKGLTPKVSAEPVQELDPFEKIMKGY